MNKRSIGIELVGLNAKDDTTQPQISALVNLMARLSHRYELSLRRIYPYHIGRVFMPFGVAQHANVPGSDHVDIGEAFPLLHVCTHARSVRNTNWGQIPVESR